jgi:cell fate regulator YaaT (PSP1 superfamily)
MPDIVGVRFKKAGKVYYFDPAQMELKAMDYVVVQTARGVELGQVTIAPKQVLASDVTAELKPITRKAGEEDIKRAQDYAAKEASALAECAKLVAKLKLPMKLVSAEYNLDGSRLTFYFTADERVDFRELVRELTAFFKTRIELRQIGPRDQAKIVGGLGRCGRSLCCCNFLTEFTPVSIKMAKEQDLPLDPMKISGVCGRLQCCLSYENTQYHEAKSHLPRRGQPVITPSGPAIVIGGNALKETVLVETESKAEAEFPLSQIQIVSESPKAAAPEAKPVEVEAAPEKPAPAPEPPAAIPEVSPKAENIPAPAPAEPAPPEVSSPEAVTVSEAVPPEVVPPEEKNNPPEAENKAE